MEEGWSCSSGRLLARHVRGPGLAPHHCNRKESYQQQKSNPGKGLPGLLLEGFEYIMGDSMPAPVSWSHGLQCQSPPPVTHACLPWSFHNFLKGSAISWRPGVHTHKLMATLHAQATNSVFHSVCRFSFPGIFPQSVL